MKPMTKEEEEAYEDIMVRLARKDYTGETGIPRIAGRAARELQEQLKRLGRFRDLSVSFSPGRVFGRAS
jgi:hypothetical protein